MNLWKGEFIMRKNVKIIVGVVVLILVLVVGSFVGLIINRTNDHKFGRYVSTEGPWGMTATWVSEDSASYLVCKKENDEPFANVTAYFQGVDGWQAYELNSIDRIVYLDIVKDGVVVDGTSGYMKFDGTTSLSATPGPCSLCWPLCSRRFCWRCMSVTGSPLKR